MRLANLAMLVGMLAVFSLLNAVPLRDIYDAAPAHEGFDKWLELSTGEIYTGGLLIGQVPAPYNNQLFGQAGKNVRINGNGAILDLQGGEIAISFCPNRLEIENCVIINGNVRYRGDSPYTPDGNIDLMPKGFVKFVTFYNCHDYAVRISGAGTGISVIRNLFMNSVDTGLDYGIYNGVECLNLPTGINCAFSVNMGQFGVPIVITNWSYHDKEAYNNNALYHFGLL